MNAAARLDALFAAADTALARRWVWAFATGLLLAWQAWLIFAHEPWADELQALLLAQQAPDLQILAQWLRYEGHPWLWYGFLRLLGGVVEQSYVLPAAALICAAIVQGGILFASPFTRAERLLLASSHYVMFEFLTISRGTSLGAALLVLAMLSWRKRWFWLVMALLPSVDFLFGVVSGVLLILQWRMRNLWWPGMVLWLVGAAIAAWSIIPAPDMVSAFDALVPLSGQPTFIESATGWLRKMGSMPLPFQGGIAPQWNSPVWPIESVGWIAMIALCWMLTRGYVWHRLLIFGFFGFTLVMSLAIYPIGLRHLMLGAFLLLLLVWLQKADAPEDKPTSSGWLRYWLIALAICGIASSTISTTRGFDAAPAAIAKIEELGLENKHWIMLPEWRSAAIAARSDIAFGRPEGACQFTFARWDYAYSALASNEKMREFLQNEIAQHGRSYLISDMSFTGFPEETIAPLAQIPAGYDGIDYILYVIGKDAPERTVNLPPCHGQNYSEISSNP